MDLGKEKLEICGCLIQIVIQFLDEQPNKPSIVVLLTKMGVTAGHRGSQLFGQASAESCDGAAVYSGEISGGLL